MGVREAVNSKSGLVGVVSGAAAVLAVFFVVYQVVSGGPTIAAPDEGYFTVDDGVTTFTGPINKPVPFSHEGKDAVRAVMFRCDDGDPFLGYLSRYSQSALTAIKAGEAIGPLSGPPTADQQRVLAKASAARQTGLEVKRPGDKNWVSAQSAEGDKIRDVKCPPGSKGRARAINP